MLIFVLRRGQIISPARRVFTSAEKSRPREENHRDVDPRTGIPGIMYPVYE